MTTILCNGYDNNGLYGLFSIVYSLFKRRFSIKLTPRNKASPFCHHSFPLRVFYMLHPKTHSIKIMSLHHHLFHNFFMHSTKKSHVNFLYNILPWIILWFSRHFHVAFQPLLCLSNFPFRCLHTLLLDE